MTVSTAILLVIIVALTVLAIRRLWKRGLCDCSDACEGGCAGCSKRCASKGCEAAVSCASCEAVQRMALALKEPK